MTHVPVGKKTGKGIPIPNVDKVAHFGLYFILTMLFAYWIGQSRRTGQAVLLAIIVCGLYGIFDEVTQAFVPSREPSLFDYLANCTGIIGGVICYGFLRLMWEKREKIHGDTVQTGQDIDSGREIDLDGGNEPEKGR